MKISNDRVVNFLKKPRQDFTTEDIIKFIKENNIKGLHFNHIPIDGRLKTLIFSIYSEDYLRGLLECGERVDGSSLFPFVVHKDSDMYIVPKFRTAFVNPFSEIPTLNILCSYFNAKGEEVDISPEYVVKKAHTTLKEKTGISLTALGELEYYIISDDEEKLFPHSKKKYQESSPFAKFNHITGEILDILSNIGIKTKYGHSEAGNIILKDGTNFEQSEIELLSEPLEDMADHIVIAKWVIRNTALKHGVSVTFIPKFSEEHAGTGLHIHIEPIKSGKNITMDKNGNISDDAKKIIGGLLELAPSLTAFGNTNPTSYLRLVPDKEAPVYIYWGVRNRTALVRIPLDWQLKYSMSKIINEGKKSRWNYKGKQTIEFRLPDGSANIHLLLAGIAVAARHGLQNKNSMKFATDYVWKDGDKITKFKQLPGTCADSARRLKEQEKIYLENKIFSQKMIDGIIRELESFKQIKCKDGDELQSYKQFFHYG